MIIATFVLILLTGCSLGEAHVRELKTLEIQVKNRVVLQESDALPLLFPVHVETRDSMAVITDVSSGVVHVYSSTSGRYIGALEPGLDMMERALRDVRALHGNGAYISFDEAAERMGISVDELASQVSTKPKILVARIDPHSDTIFATASMRLFADVEGLVTSFITNVLIKYELKTLRMASLTVIDHPSVTPTRLFSGSVMAFLGRDLLVNEFDSTFMNDFARHSLISRVPLYTRYTRDGQRLGGDVSIRTEILADFGYGFQFSQPRIGPNERLLFTSGVSPYCLVIDSTTREPQEVSYSNVVQHVMPMLRSNRSTGTRMKNNPPNAFLCSGFQQGASLYAATFTDWNTSTTDSIVSHLVFASFDPITSSLLPRGHIAIRERGYNAMRVVDWPVPDSVVRVLERNVATKDWCITTYSVE